MLKIFLAHAKEDKEAVTDLYFQLKKSGYQPWLDKEDLLPGQNWRAEIPKAIKNSQVFIACLSTRSVVKQGYVQSEFKIALKEYASKPPESIYLIPVRLDDCLIPELRQEEYGANLRDIQWLDFFEPNGFEKLLRALEYAKELGQQGASITDDPIRDLFPHTQLPQLPSEPEVIAPQEQFVPESQTERRNVGVGNPESSAINIFYSYLSNRYRRFAVLAILTFICVLIAWHFISLNKSPEPQPNPSQPLNLDIKEGASSGEQLLMSRDICKQPERDCKNSLSQAEKGSKAFSNDDYDSAAAYFEDAISQYANNPELHIYRNNALVRKAIAEGYRGRKITLAAAVPASGDTSGRGEEMLRGIADAQSCFVGRRENTQYVSKFNCPSDLTDLLEIVIVDDKNNRSVAKENADIIVNDSDILGVIGHYASGVTDEALSVYSIGPIPVVSPASTKYKLKNKSNFLRTTASTRKLGQAMATYLKNKDIDQVLGTYDSEDEYSLALWFGFEDAYPQEKIVGKTRIESPNSADALISKIESISDNIKFAVVVIPPSNFENGTLSSEKQKWDLVAQISEAVKKKNANGGNGFLIGGNDLYDPESINPSRGLQGMILTVPWFSGAFENISESYAAIAFRNWGDARVSWVTANSYDATQVFMKALAGIDSENNQVRNELIDKLQNVQIDKEYTSGIGIEFEDREPTRNPFLLEVVDSTPAQTDDRYDFQILSDPRKPY